VARPILSLFERQRRRAHALVAPAATKARSRFWSGELRVARVFDETDDIRTFRFVHAKSETLPFDYRAGQYLNLTLSIDDKRVLRSYTISSSPTRVGYCEISVKREPKGVASQWLHEHLVEGALVRVGAPAGKFVFDPAEAKSVVLIAGGVGITPIMAIVRNLTDRSWDGAMHLLYCAKTEADLAFRDELALLGRRFPNLHVAMTLSREDGDRWTGARGRLSRELFLGVGGVLARSPIYLCGPDDMMAATKQLLADLDIPAHQIRTEAFVSAAPAATVAEAPRAPSTGTLIDTKESGEGESARIRFHLSSKEADLTRDQTILEASEDAGVDIPFECRSGICGQCKIKLIKGTVRMDVEDALHPRDRERGLVLACQAHATSDIVVDA